MPDAHDRSHTFYKPALTALGLVLLSLLAAIAAPLGSRFGFWNFDAAVVILKVAAGGFIAGTVLSMFSAIATRPGSLRRGFFISLLGLVITVPTLGFLYFWQEAKNNFPPMVDISTDPDKPPEFWAAPNSRVYDEVSGSAFQMEFYPDIEPLLVDIPPDRACELALEVVRDKDWEIWEENCEARHIEATDRTFWFGFSDDVVIHITATEDGGSRIDMRSASRFGSGSDGGTNARRIRGFFKALRERLPH